MSAPMLRSALRELKFHPARYVATLVAIAISVGFLAASSILTSTESNAAGVQTAQPYSTGDLVVSVKSWPAEMTSGKVTSAISSVPGVREAAAIDSGNIIVENGSNMVMVAVTALPSQEYIWTSLKQGTWPDSAQIALNSKLQETLGVKLGDTVTIAGQKLTVVGITVNPPSSFSSDPAIVGPDFLAQCDRCMYGTSWVVRLDSGANASTVGASIVDALSPLGVNPKAQTTGDFIEDSSEAAMGNVNGMKYILYVFAGIATVVGMITIANTFTILLAQRRRQTGLIRTIGASGTQVRRSIWLEALVLGLLGAVLGVGLACGLTALVGLYTGSIGFGLKVPVLETSIAMAVGLVITLLAAVVPARKATEISPIEALQPAETSVQAGASSAARTALCGFLVVAGLAGCLLSLKGGSLALALAVVGAMLTSLGVLFGARTFVPSLLKVAGALVRRWNPAASVAAKNVTRDPARATATATALMLAVGLIITLQVGAASVNTTMQSKISSEYPVDMYVSAYGDDGMSLSGRVGQISRIAGVGSVVAIECKALPSDFKAVKVCNYTPEVAGFAPGLPASVGDDQIMYSEMNSDGDIVTLGSRDLVTETSPVIMGNQYLFVSPVTYAAVDGESLEASLVFLTVTDPAKIASIQKSIGDIAGPVADVGGAAMAKSMIQQMMNILVGMVSALLAVAVLIALVGVGNTLTLSVIERARENAILRALGFQTGQLKVMLLAEAMLLTLVGAVVGVAAGAFFGWIGSTALVAQLGASDGIMMKAQFALNWPQTLGLLAVLVVAAGLASILPGRRAAKASPVEALAEV